MAVNTNNQTINSYLDKPGPLSMMPQEMTECFGCRAGTQIRIKKME